MIFSLLSYKSYQQYQIWQENDVSKYFLPPYQSVVYFIKYSFIHFFQKHLISLGAGLLFLGLANLLNNRFQKRFFEEEEPYLGALGLFTVGHPLWIFYFIAVMAIGVLGSLFLKVSSSKLQALSRRFPFYYFWLPVAIIVMIIGKILI